MLTHSTIPVTLSSNLITFHDTGKEFELKQNFSKMITYKNYNIDLASLTEKNCCMTLQRKCFFDVKAQGNKSN